MHLISLFQHLLASFGDSPLSHGGFWAYPLISIMVAIEGPMVILLSSTASSTGLLKPIPVFIAASIGNLSADLVWYSLGYFSKLEWIIDHIKWIGIKRDVVDTLKIRLQQNAAKILFLAKLTNGLVVPTLITAGLARIPLRKWFPFVAIAETIVTGSLVAIGYYAAFNLLKVEKGIQYVFFGLTILFMLVIIYFVQKVLRQRTTIEATNINEK